MMLTRRSLLLRAFAAGTLAGMTRMFPWTWKPRVEEERLDIVAEAGSWNCVVTYFDRDFVKRQEYLSIPKTCPPWHPLPRAPGTPYNVTWL